MCTYITATLNAEADAAQADKTFKEEGLKLEPQRNPTVESYIGSGRRYYFATGGMCACGAALASKKSRRRVSNDVKQWLAALKKLFDRGIADEIGILVHEYGDGLEEEQIELSHNLPTPLREIDADFLVQMDQDRIYYITNSPY